VILVYQMAKVASRSWVEAVKPTAAQNSETTHHVHFAMPHNRERMRAALAAPGGRQTIANTLMPKSMQRKSLEVSEDIEIARRDGKTIRVVTGMRDPVARSISWLFFMADFYGHVSRPLNPRAPMTSDYVIGALQSIWQSIYERGEPKETFEWYAWFLTGAFRTWFDDELNMSLGIDVRATPFPAGIGAQRLTNPGVDVLVYRVEDMTPSAPAYGALLATAESFLQTPLPALPSVNTSATRRTRELYETVRQEMYLPPHLLDAIYSEPIVRHFYSADEIAAFKSRWSGR
jgi:hypothetical protein